MDAADVDKIAEAGRTLEVRPRGDRWCHLSLCVIDAVFSVGARYGSTWRAARRYACCADLEPVTAPADEVASGVHAQKEERLSAFRSFFDDLTDVDLADRLGNRQRTSSRGGILKAQAVREYVNTLAERNVQTLGDVANMLADHDRLAEVEAALSQIRGHGSGVRVSYLWMLAGDDYHVKPDRMVISWSSRVLGRSVSPSEASALVVAAAKEIEATPWELDHAVWRRQSGRAASKN